MTNTYSWHPTGSLSSDSRYKPCPLQYVPPKLEHLDVHELAAAAVDEDAQEEGDGGADAGTAGAEGAPDGRPGEAGDGEAVGADADNGDAAGEAADEEAGGDAAAAGTSAGVGLPAADGAGALEGREAPQQGQGTAGPSGGGGAGGGGGGGGGTEMDGTSRAWRQRQMHVIEPFAKSDCARINFDAGAVRNRAASKASGRKRHRGPPPLQGSALLARIERKPLPPPPAPAAAAEAGAGAGKDATGEEGGKAAAAAAAAPEAGATGAAGAAESGLAGKAGGTGGKEGKGGGSSAPRHAPSFPVWAVSGGQLLEVNERLAADPGLVFERPCREGYVALLFPTKEQAAGLRRRLLGEAQYLALRGLTPEDLM
ncbi:hypothetical protein CHLRE_09g392400v5 [Chlamydomonas reinhardtii]|uniref:Protein Abitram n=1 Tax=Chlamydomonas reinhardtii TaxID=3055 RepID=A0A2K3DDF4_CHLRE|nr:uncharacterized protein CHLRE_09g392400v5 [Chlamydomonas reinhardtii]PNW78556.1 hypothetical protein CHLRE_09g392400v5 [Chlamydomonas reinhardtii]